MQNPWLTNVLASGGKKPSSSFGGPFDFITKPIAGTGRSIRRTSTEIKKKLDKVPVVGPALHGVYTIVPIPGLGYSVGFVELAGRIAAGENIKKAAYNALKERVKAYQDLAPYAQTVVSTVPGVGQGLSGAIGAANALSKGRPINEAAIEAVRGAVPGGPMGQAAFDVAIAVIQKKPIEEVVLNALPIAPEQKKLVIVAAQVARDVAEGKRVDESLYNRGIKLLPPEAQIAMQVGVALAQGQRLQDIAKQQLPNALPLILDKGAEEISKDPTLQAGLKALSDPTVQEGFKTGVGLVQHKTTPTEVLTVRKELSPAAKKGFDIAVSTHVGNLSQKIPDGLRTPLEKFGFLATGGMLGAKPQAKEKMVRTLIKNPEMKKGVVEAIREIKPLKLKHELSFWEKVKKFFTEA